MYLYISALRHTLTRIGRLFPQASKIEDLLDSSCFEYVNMLLKHTLKVIQ